MATEEPPDRQRSFDESETDQQGLSLLLDVYKYRYLSVTQLERLHFPSKRTAYRRLQALTTLKCLKAFSPPNIPERIFYLDREGAELVAGEMHVTLKTSNGTGTQKTPKDLLLSEAFPLN